MAIHGLDDEVFPYTLEIEEKQGVPQEDRTVFWLYPIYGKKMTKLQSIIERSRKVDKRTQRRMDDTDPDAAHRANKEGFLMMVDHIDQYVFSKSHPKYENGKLHSDIYDPGLLADIAETLPNQIMGELFDACSGDRLTGVEEKKDRGSDLDSDVAGDRT